MKTIFTFLFALLISMQVFSQSISIADGNWYMPTTWQGGIIPTPGSNVLINHVVTLTSNWGYNTGSIYVSATGVLTQDVPGRKFGQQGGTFTNEGIVNISVMGFIGGTMNNSGSISAADSLYIGINLNNGGTLTSGNLYNAATLTNNNHINVVNFFNNATAINSSNFNFNNCLNAGTLTNNNLFHGTHDFTNAGILTNNLSATISIENNCTNNDSINHDAHWYNNGHTLIGNDFTNVNILEGTAPGSFCVTNNSSNLLAGTVLGDFDFCDYLTSGFGINYGTISNVITYCTSDCFSGIDENNISDFIAFPNPVKENITLQFKGDVSEKNIQIVNSCGQFVFVQSISGTDEVTISRNSLPAGFYLLKVSNNNSTLTKKLIFE
jgi:hypothetical protein